MRTAVEGSVDLPVAVAITRATQRNIPEEAFVIVTAVKTSNLTYQE
jgi:hypothetical protein